MKIKKLVLVSVTVILLAFVIGCSSSGSGSVSSATVKVNGTAGKAYASKGLDSDYFYSGKVKINNEDITSKLKPTKNTTKGANNVEFEATVEVSTPMVELSVNPDVGFVFDEWELDKKTAKADRKAGTLSKSDYKALKLTDKDEKAETLTVKANLVKYYKATFDHGYYVNLSSTSTTEDGSKTTPYKSIKALVDELKTKTTSNEDDELTIKIAGNSTQLEDLDLSELKGYEELKIIGGFDNSWALTTDKTKFSNFLIGSAIEELQIEHLSFDSITLSNISEELEIVDCEVKDLNAAADSVIINMIVTGTVPSSVSFVNSVAKYDASNSYYHCLIKDVPEGAKIKGANNILVGAITTPIANNLIVSDSDIENTYKVKSTVTDISKAKVIQKLNEKLEDLLEEDIEGRDREEAEDGKTPAVSYGPYEYLEDIDD